MIRKIAEFCRQKELLHPGDRILLGLSGGADSVCLFLVLQALKEEWKLEIVPVHVHHGLRGAEADADMEYCDRLCKSYDISLIKEGVSVAELAERNGWTVEEAGRNARYEIFAKWREKLGCDSIAVAHHKNDQAETVLFQLFRGSRLKGLAGMEAKREAIIRPLLCVTREEIEAYLKECGQAYCTDRTNLEENYTRNRIRAAINQSKESIQPKIVEHIADTAEYLGAVERFLERQTEELWERCRIIQPEAAGGIQIHLRVQELTEAEPLLAERVVYKALCTVAGQRKDVTAFAVKQCMELTNRQSGRRVSLMQGVTAEKAFDSICIFRDREEATAFFQKVEELPLESDLPDGTGRLRLELLDTGENPEMFIKKLGGIPKSTYTKWFDYDKIIDSVSLKTLQSEDEIAIYTDGRGKRALDVLAEAKIPKEERIRRVCLAAKNRILWIPGIRSSEAYRVTEATKRILKATIDGGENDGR